MKKRAGGMRPAFVLLLRVTFAVACNDEENATSPSRYPAACGGEIHQERAQATPLLRDSSIASNLKVRSFQA
jgi:hypothetical protein